jgi:hypothetical protein
LHEQVTALRQALDQLPDTTKMMGLIPSEWVGIAEPPNSTTDVVEREWQGLTDEDVVDLQKASWVDNQAFEAVAWMIDEFLEKKNI